MLIVTLHWFLLSIIIAHLWFFVFNIAGSFDIVQVKDATGHQFATRLHNVFIIGKGNKPYVSLPKGKGIRLSIAEERDRRLAEKAKML